MEIANGKTPFAGMKPLKVLKMILQNAPPKLDGKFSQQFQDGMPPSIM
jgi:hypothetical protein